MIVAGIGFSTRSRPDSLRDALQRACAAARIEAPQALATAEDKEPTLAPLAINLGVPLYSFSAQMLSAQSTLTYSPRVAAERCIGSVAEAAALAGAGPGSRLLTSRIHAEDRLASCALAEGIAI
ncbi:MAG: cobalamin biosynthesis protein [Candidatus Phaeomarinobacter sp.]